MSANAAMRVSRNAALLLAGTACRMVLSLTLVVYAAAKLGVAGFGSFSIGVHFFELCLSLAATAVGIYLTREAAKRPRRTGELVAYGLVLASGIALTLSAGLLVAAPWLGYARTTQQALAVGSLALLPAATGVVFEAAFVAHERAGFVAAGTALESVLRLGLSFAALASGGGVLGMFAALVVSRSVQAAYYYSRLLSVDAPKWRFRRRGFVVFLRHWRVFAGENWLATLHTSLDVVVLSIVGGEKAVGIYDAAYKIIRPGSVVARSYTTAVFPLMSRLATDSRDAFLRLSGDSLRVMLAAAAPVGVVLTLLAERVVGQLYQPEFAPAAVVLQILVWVLVLECINPFLSYTLFAQGAQRRSLQVAAISLAINAVATPPLAVAYGAAGAAAGTLAAGVVAATCYATFSLPRRNLAQFGWTTLKVAGAGGALAASMRIALPNAWPLALAIGGVAYFAVLLLLRVVTVGDLRALSQARGIA